MVLQNIGRLSPHNCTVCKKFEGNLVFRSDSEPDIQAYEDVIWIDCKRFGKRDVNNELIVCSQFDFDPDKESIVIRDPEYAGVRSMMRIWKRAYVRAEIDPLQRTIYNMVCNVQDEDPRGWMLQVCVNRVHLDTGTSREAVFRCVMGMIEAGYLVRVSIDNLVFLQYPPVVSNIVDIGKRKVTA